MAVIALNWELGADLGHIGRFLPLALRLRDLGHRPVMLLRDIGRAEALLGEHGLEFLQAPLWHAAVSGLPAADNYTETLFRFGFLHPEGLLSVCRAWRAAWALLRPRLLIFDHAPTAMLAARGAGMARVVIGNSFSIPPVTRPLPPYRWWADTTADQARRDETEARATRNANAVLQRLPAPPIRQVADIFEAEATFLCTRPELDGYGPRPARYIGPIASLDLGDEPRWPEGPGARVFTYLKSNYRPLEALLEVLSRSPDRYLVFAAGLPEALRRKHQSKHLTFSAAPLRMRAVAAQCDAVICHAGGGVTDTALAAGKPLLLLPTQMEQTMTARRVIDLGAGLMQPADGNPANLGKLVKQLTSDPELARKARAFADSAGVAGQEVAIAAVIDTCTALLEPQGGPPAA